MTFLRGLVEQRSGVENPAVPLTSTTLLDWLGGPKSSAGVPVTEQSSLGMPAVWRAVNLISGTSASLPLKAYKRADASRLPLETGQAANLLNDPHPDMTSFELWELAYGHLCLWGNAYLRKLRDGSGALRELWGIHPSRVRAGRESETGRKIYQIDSGSDPFYDDTILHIPGFGYDGVCGLSPIRAAREGIGLALAAEQYGAKLFGNGSLATGILQTDQRLTQEQSDILHRRWKAKRSGLQSAHETIILDQGAKFQQLSIPPGDAQFIESRKFQITEVARMFGIPPHMLSDTERTTSWGTGIEQQSIGFVVYTLRPWLTRVEQRVTKMLQPANVFASYSVEGLLRGDSAQRAAFYKSLWELGVLSTNDIRTLENWGPVDKGDVRYRPLNFGELGQPNPDLVPAVGDQGDAL